MEANVVTKFRYTPMTIVREIEISSSIYGSVLRIFQSAIIFAILDRSPKSDSLYDCDSLHNVWMNLMKIGRGAGF